MSERVNREWKEERELLIKALHNCEKKLCNVYEITKGFPFPSAELASHCDEAGDARKLLRECGVRV